MLPAQPRTPAAKAHRVPRSRLPVAESLRENPSATITGTRPTVESAWLCAAERACPIIFERMAQTPHERSATSDQSSQRGMFKEFPIPSLWNLELFIGFPGSGHGRDGRPGAKSPPGIAVA